MHKKMTRCPYPNPKYKTVVYKSTCRGCKVKSAACEVKKP